MWMPPKVLYRDSPVSWKQPFWPAGTMLAFQYQGVKAYNDFKMLPTIYVKSSQELANRLSFIWAVSGHQVPIHSVQLILY